MAHLWTEFITLLNNSPRTALRLSDLSELTKHSSPVRGYITMTRSYDYYGHVQYRFLRPRIRHNTCHNGCRRKWHPTSTKKLRTLSKSIPRPRYLCLVRWISRALWNRYTLKRHSRINTLQIKMISTRHFFQGVCPADLMPSTVIKPAIIVVKPRWTLHAGIWLGSSQLLWLWVCLIFRYLWSSTTDAINRGLTAKPLKFFEV
jgi:hypothetical protein